MIIVEPILTLEETYPSGRFYPLAEGQEVVDQINGVADFFFISESSDTPEIPLDRVAGRVSNARIEDNKVVVDIKLLKTPMGAIMEALHESDAKLTYTLAATGMINTENDRYVVSKINALYAYAYTSPVQPPESL